MVKCSYGFFSGVYDLYSLWPTSLVLTLRAGEISSGSSVQLGEIVDNFRGESKEARKNSTPPPWFLLLGRLQHI